MTGGGTGLGRAMTETFLDHGAEVAIASRKRYKQAADELGIPGFELDVREEASVQGVVDEVVGELGGLDLLVNNAAGNFLSPATELSENGWRAVLDIVLDGTFRMSKAAHPALSEAEDASVVNIVATYAWTAAPFVAHSGAAKAGVLNLTRSLACEWGESVRVNAIAPGPVVTEKASEHLGYDDPDVQAKLAKKIPLNRLGQPEEIADAALFLSSPAAQWITGECLVVDGGQWLQGNLFDAMMSE